MPLHPGLSAAVELVVTDDDTALALKTGDVPVLATPRVVTLAEEATVRAVDASGRQVMASQELIAGVHSLDLASSRSTLFVQVRSGSSTTTLPLEPIR